MKIFISWSGDRAKKLAEELREWLPTVIQSLEPFISARDIPPGGRALSVLASELQECRFGILCLTNENREKPWILFEAGALSKVIDASRVVPLLLDLKPSDISGPLAQFQAISANDKSGVLKLIKSLAELIDTPRITDQILARTFEKFWPELEAKVMELKSTASDHAVQPVRSDRDLLEEILGLNRGIERELARMPSEFSARVTLPLSGTAGPQRGFATGSPGGFDTGPQRRFVREAAIVSVQQLEVNVTDIDAGPGSDLMHVAIDDPDKDANEVRGMFRSISDRFGVTIQVMGEPIGHELFGPGA